MRRSKTRGAATRTQLSLVYSLSHTPPLGTYAVPLVFSCARRLGGSGQGTGRLPSHGRQPPRQRWRAACRKGAARGGGSTGDSEPAPDALSAAGGGRYTCVHAPAATGQPPASASSGSGDQQLSDSQQPTTTVTKPMSSASTMYTSALPVRRPVGGVF
ncbi:unnamed protein product, partial [Iphiclides podalirius]